MRRALSALLAAAALTVLVAACGGSGAGQPVATNDVAMSKSYVFEPGAVEVRAGSTVTWRNDDNFTHTVQVDGQDDHLVERGESVSISFDTPGTYHYVCTLHRQDMEGRVIVR